MPVYDEQTFNYEILLRFGDADPYKGLLRGASRTTITQTTKDGVPIATSINPPEQLALVAGEEGELLSNVLGEVATETIVLNGQLQSALAEVNAIVAQQLEDLTKVRADLSLAQTVLADSQRALTDQKAAAESVQSDLQAQINHLTDANQQVVADLQAQIEQLQAELLSKSADAAG